MSRWCGLPLALLFIAFTAPTIAQTVTEAAAAAAAAEVEVDKVQYYELFKPLILNCTPDNPEINDVQYHWKKNDTDVQLKTDGRGASTEEQGALLVYKHASEDEYGIYSCSIGQQVARTWDVRAHTIARLPANSNVVEGQKLSLVCKLHGKPAARVQWRYSPPGTGDDDKSEGVLIDTTSEGARFTAKESPAGVPGALLELAAAQDSDAGVYYCAAENGTRGKTVLRVKDVYAALWPFLGICLEVFILCAIILVYEKRRTKPEMDDSDADNHDQ